MTWSLRAQPEAVGVLSSRVEQALGIPAAHAEKDFWVTEALRAATDGARDEDVTLVFKGGTSLVKTERVRLVRHYYDVWCLLRDEATVRGFDDWPCDALAKEVQAHTEYAGLRTTPRPADGFAASPAFSERTRAVRKAFEQNVLAQLVWGPPDEKPSLDECCDLVQEMSGRL